jgi:hypothetical protein
LSRAATGQLGVTLSRVNLNTILENVVDAARPAEADRTTQPNRRRTARLGEASGWSRCRTQVNQRSTASRSPSTPVQGALDAGEPRDAA